MFTTRHRASGGFGLETVKGGGWGALFYIDWCGIAGSLSVVPPRLWATQAGGTEPNPSHGGRAHHTTQRMGWRVPLGVCVYWVLCPVTIVRPLVIVCTTGAAILRPVVCKS